MTVTIQYYPKPVSDLTVYKTIGIFVENGALNIISLSDFKDIPVLLVK